MNIADSIAPRAVRLIAPALLCICASPVAAQQLDTRFSCSVTRNVGGEPVIFADNGSIRLNGSRIDSFQWESALFSAPHSADCSIDESDGLHAESQENSWRITVPDGRGARSRRGYTFAARVNCSIRLEREGNTLHVKPTCPALCGSRQNFSELSVDLKTGTCRYEE